MTRRRSLLSAFVLLLTTALSITPALAIEEPDRLWLVGERAFADGLHPLARRALERLIDRYPRDGRLGPALLMLGKVRLTLGDLEAALDAFRRAQKLTPPPGERYEARFWEAEALFRLKRHSEARAAYEDITLNDAAGPFAPDAFYGYGWTELELKRPEPAVTAFRDLLKTWPDHALAPSAAYHLARALVELKRASEAVPLLADFAKKYPGHKFLPEAQYLLGLARLEAGDTKGALTDLRAFVEAYPSDRRAAEVRKLITQTKARSGGKEELEEAYVALMTQAPPTPEALAEAASIAGRLDNARDQEMAWRKLRAEFPGHPLAHKTALDLANAAFKRKEWKDVVAYAEAAAKSDDDATKAEAWLLAGESELKLKRHGPAAKAFEAVGAVTGADEVVRYRALAGLGLAREELKELRAALTAYEAVAAKSPDPALRDWARQRASAVKGRLQKPAGPPAAKPKPKS